MIGSKPVNYAPLQLFHCWPSQGGTSALVLVLFLVVLSVVGLSDTDILFVMLTPTLP